MDRQLPRGEEIFLDHVGHFAADPEAASAALSRAGFFATPRSVQVNPRVSASDKGGVTLTGTGNVTSMFASGYIEVLYKTADTVLGRELDSAISRYAGVHLAAFSVSDAAAAHRRLESSGFRVRPIADMQRPVETEAGDQAGARVASHSGAGRIARQRMHGLNDETER